MVADDDRYAEGECVDSCLGKTGENVHREIHHTRRRSTTIDGDLQLCTSCADSPPCRVLAVAGQRVRHALLGYSIRNSWGGKRRKRDRVGFDISAARLAAATRENPAFQIIPPPKVRD